MAEMSDVVARALARHRDDPTRLVQMLREVQEELDWIAPETMRAIAAGPRRPDHARAERRRSSIRSSTTGRAAAIASSSPTTSPTACPAAEALMEHMLKRLKLRRGELSADGTRQRRAHLMHRHVRSGAGDAGQQSRGHAPDGAAHRRDLRTDADRRAAWRMAGRILPRRRQHSPARDASDAARARRRARRGDRARPTGNAGRDEALAPARPRRRGLPDRRQVRGRAQRPGRRALHRLQRRRGRARHVQGPRAAQFVSPTRVLEGMAIAGYVVGATKGFIYLRGEYMHLHEKLQRDIDAMRA